MVWSRPDALWVLNPELVLHVPPGKEKQPNYGTISGMFILMQKIVA